MGTNSTDTVYTIAIETRDPALAERMGRAIADSSANDPEPAPCVDSSGKSALRRELKEQRERADSLRDQFNAEVQRRIDLEDTLDRMSETDHEKEISRLREENRRFDTLERASRAAVVDLEKQLERAKSRLRLTGDLCRAAQLWEGPARGAVTDGFDVALLEACATYESAMSVLADAEQKADNTEDDIPF